MDVQIDSIFQSGQFKKLRDEQIAGLRKKYNMKKVELEILYFLSHCDGGNTSTDIHYHLMMNKGHISQAVDSLCKRSFLSAIQDEKDRRYVHYEVLESAQEIVDEIGRIKEERNRKLLEGISEEELMVFRKVAMKIKNNMAGLLQEQKRL